MYILGISSFYHDSSACLVKDGEIVAAGPQEVVAGTDHLFLGTARSSNCVDRGFCGSTIHLHIILITGKKQDN